MATSHVSFRVDLLGKHAHVLMSMCNTPVVWKSWQTVNELSWDTAVADVLCALGDSALELLKPGMRDEGWSDAARSRLAVVFSRRSAATPDTEGRLWFGALLAELVSPTNSPQLRAAVAAAMSTLKLSKQYLSNFKELYVGESRLLLDHRISSCWRSAPDRHRPISVRVVAQAHESTSQQRRSVGCWFVGRFLGFSEFSFPLNAVCQHCMLPALEHERVNDERRLVSLSVEQKRIRALVAASKLDATLEPALKALSHSWRARLSRQETVALTHRPRERLARETEVAHLSAAYALLSRLRFEEAVYPLQLASSLAAVQQIEHAICAYVPAQRSAAVKRIAALEPNSDARRLQSLVSLAAAAFGRAFDRWREQQQQQHAEQFKSTSRTPAHQYARALRTLVAHLHQLSDPNENNFRSFARELHNFRVFSADADAPQRSSVNDTSSVHFELILVLVLDTAEMRGNGGLRPLPLADHRSAAMGQLSGLALSF